MEYKFKVRNSGINPFLTNPVRAYIRDKKDFRRLISVNISHAYSTDKGIECVVESNEIELPYSMPLDKLTISNLHEADRLLEMFRMLIKAGHTGLKKAL